MHKTKMFCILGIGMLTAGFAQTQQDSVKVKKLDEVVISDSRFQLKRENSGKTVIKISQAEIERNQGRTVAELINTKSGIEINGSRSNSGQNLGVFIRGGRNRQVLVLIDGVQVSDPSQISNEYDLRLLSLGNIESIEIIKGAASTLYGSGAAAAVINITTKKAGKNAINALITSSIGTNQSQDDQDYNIADFNNSVAINGSADRFNYRAAFNQQFTDGISAAITDENNKDAFSKYSIDLNLGYKFSDVFSLNVYGNITDINSDFDNGQFAEGDNQFNSDQYRVGLSSKYSYTNGSVNLNASYSKFEREFVSGSVFATEADNYILDVYNKYTFNKTFYTIAGLNVIESRTVFSENEDFNNIDPYLNTVYVSDFGLNINAGARLNNHNEYGSNLIYNINPSYVFNLNDNDYVKVFGSYSTSFIAPSLSQLFGAFGPNPDLDPEENLTIEGGLEVKLGDNFRASALYFNREEEDLIIFGAAGYINASETINTEGFELEVIATSIEDLSITANYTFVENKDNVAALIPKHKANLALGYDFSDRTFASLAYQFTGDRLTTDFRDFTLVMLSSFSLVNLSFSHTLKNNKIKLFGSLDNLLNEDYQDVFGFTTRGANVRVGFTFNLL